LEKAAAIEVIARELLEHSSGDLIARQMVNNRLDHWIANNAIGEVGGREITTSREFPLPNGVSMWPTKQIAYKVTVMAKRPYWIKHIRAEAKA